MIAAVALVGMAALACLGGRHVWHHAQTDALYDAALRYWYAQHRQPERIEREGLYVSVDDADPDGNLLRRLHASVPPARQASNWADPPGTGIRVWLYTPKWISTFTAEVVIVDRNTWVSVAGERYEVRYTRGGWEISKATPLASLVLRD